MMPNGSKETFEPCYILTIFKKNIKKSKKNSKKVLTNRICSAIIVKQSHRTLRCNRKVGIAAMAQLVERVLGKDEVPGPNPGSSSIFTVRKDCEHEKPLFNKGFSCFFAIFCSLI